MKHCKKCKYPFFNDSYCPNCVLKDPKNNLWVYEMGLVVIIMFSNVLFKIASNSHPENIEYIDNFTRYDDESTNAKLKKGFGHFPNYLCKECDEKNERYRPYYWVSN